MSEVVVDDRVFDRTFVHPSWPAEKLDRGEDPWDDDEDGTKGKGKGDGEAKE